MGSATDCDRRLLILQEEAPPYRGAPGAGLRRAEGPAGQHQDPQRRPQTHGADSKPTVPTPDPRCDPNTPVHGWGSWVQNVGDESTARVWTGQTGRGRPAPVEALRGDVAALTAQVDRMAKALATGPTGPQTTQDGRG